MQSSYSQEHQPVMPRSIGSLFVGSFLFAALVLASISTAVDFVTPEKKTSANDENHRSIGEYRKDVKAFMKLSKHDDEALQRNAIYNLCALHAELVCDPRFESSQRIQGCRAIVAKRLDGYSKDFKKQQAAEERRNKKAKRASSLNDSASSLTDAGTDDTQADNAGTLATDSGLYDSNDETDEQAQYDAMYQAAAESYHSMGQFSGGPNQLFDYAGGRFAPPWDHGPELVALITNTIDPAFWRQNGGNGSIHYFQPLRVLVIGATTRVQDDTLELLWKLRAAGR